MDARAYLESIMACADDLLLLEDHELAAICNTARLAKIDNAMRELHERSIENAPE